MLRVLVALLVVSTAFALVTPPFIPDANFNCVTDGNPNCFCQNGKSWSMTPITPTYAVPDMNFTALNGDKVFFQASVLRYGATPGKYQSSSGGGPWLHPDTTKPCYWTSTTGALTCSFRVRLLPSSSSTLLGSATLTGTLTVQQGALNSGLTPSLNPTAQATAANSGFSLAGTLTLTVTGLNVATATAAAASAGYSTNDRLIFAQLANPVTLQFRRSWDYPTISSTPGSVGTVDFQTTTSPNVPIFLYANRVSQSYARYKDPTKDNAFWRMALWGADVLTPASSTKVAIDLYFTMTSCDGTPPTPNGGGTPEEICLDVTPQVKKYCPPAQTSTQVSSTTSAVALSFTSTGC